MANLKVSFACGPYDRMQAIYDGRVPIEGVDLVPVPIDHPMEVFSRMLDADEFDVAEMSFTHCFVLQARNAARFVGLPVFPSRMFRHGFIFVNRKAGIATPADLDGKRVGVQGYQMTAAVWIRGILREYGARPETMRWFEGGVNEKGVFGGASTAMRPAREIDIQDIGTERTLSDLLAAGEIDALIGALKPDSFGKDPDVVRLFPEPHRVEREYFERTGIHPIMHGLVLRKETHERHPWLAQRVYDACETAKSLALRQMRFSGALRYMLPWLMESIEEIDAVFAGDAWPYGVAANRVAIDAFNRHLVDDGFYAEPLPLDRVFAVL